MQGICYTFSRPLGVPVSVIDSDSPDAELLSFAISDTGSLVYVTGSNVLEEGTLVWVDREGQASPIIEEPGSY